MTITPNLYCDKTKNRGAYTRLTGLMQRKDSVSCSGPVLIIGKDTSPLRAVSLVPKSGRLSFVKTRNRGFVDKIGDLSSRQQGTKGKRNLLPVVDSF